MSSIDYMSMMGDLENQAPTDDAKIRRAPFGYLGGKSHTLKYILPLLPVTDRYIEPFGGSASVLINRPISKLEIYNDRYGGVVAFYRVLRSPAMLDALMERLEYTIHSREEWHWCADTWKNCEDDVERAARWYYMHRLSFAQKGMDFGRSKDPICTISSKIRNTLPKFKSLHDRFKNVQVENQDWHDCMMDYDHGDTVFYLDPPYLESFGSSYRATGFGLEQHKQLLHTIFESQGFVAISAYPNKLYDGCEWDAVHEFDSYVSITKQNTGQATNDRGSRKEALYIKEAR